MVRIMISCSLSRITYKVPSSFRPSSLWATIVRISRLTATCNDKDKRIDFFNDRETLRKLFNDNPEYSHKLCPSSQPLNFEMMYGLNSNPIAEIVSAPFDDETSVSNSDETHKWKTYPTDALTVCVLGKLALQVPHPILRSSSSLSSFYNSQ